MCKRLTTPYTSSLYIFGRDIFKRRPNAFSRIAKKTFHPPPPTPSPPPHTIHHHIKFRCRFAFHIFFASSSSSSSTSKLFGWPYTLPFFPNVHIHTHISRNSKLFSSEEASRPSLCTAKTRPSSTFLGKSFNFG